MQWYSDSMVCHHCEAMVKQMCFKDYNVLVFKGKSKEKMMIMDSTNIDSKIMSKFQVVDNKVMHNEFKM